jgi:hypothetical protein
MSFKHQLFEFEELETQTINGKRHYHVNGEYFPSVTTVLSVEEKPGLDAWRKRVGDAEADRVMKKSASRGEGMHSLLEAYVLNKDMKEAFALAMPNHIRLFKQIQPLLDKYLGNVYAIESPMYSATLGIAGRVDLIGDWKGKPAVIDFKSSIRRKKPEWIHGYYKQEALYSFMMNEMHGFFVPRLVTLVAHDEESSAEVFEERAAPWLAEAIKVVEKFYQLAAEKPTEMIK